MLKYDSRSLHALSGHSLSSFGGKWCFYRTFPFATNQRGAVSGNETGKHFSTPIFLFNGWKMLIGRRPHVSKKTKEVVWQAAGLTLEEGILKCEMCHLTSAETRRVWRGGSGSRSPSWTWRCSGAGRDVYEVITRLRYTLTKAGW